MNRRLRISIIGLMFGVGMILNLVIISNILNINDSLLLGLSFACLILFTFFTGVFVGVINEIDRLEEEGK